MLLAANHGLSKKNDFTNLQNSSILRINDEVLGEQHNVVKRKANKKQFDDPIKRKIHSDSFLLNNGNHKNTVWVNNGIKSKRVDKTHISNYINNGWVKGRLLKDTQFWKHGNRNKDPKTGRFVKKGE